MTRKDLETLADLVAERLVPVVSELFLRRMPERFSSKVAVGVHGCWCWQASRNKKGYGQYTVKGRPVLAHRFAYEHMHGDIPSGLHIDHLCRVRHCVNPLHLEAVTPAENFRRGRRWP